METENTSKTSIINEKFNCFNCDFKCCKKGDWTRHLATTKHKNLYNVTTGDEELHKNTSNYTCEKCLKNYISRNGLWLHKKKCKSTEETAPQIIEESISGASISDISNNVIQLLINENKELINDNKDFKNLIMELVKSNTDLQKQMLEVCKNGSTTINTNNSHNNNKTFNLQVFLNEKCKDAMNIMDFVNSMTLELSDLEEVGNLGYVEGISNIMIRKLNEMEVHKRPIHCSDAKREIMYVRDNNVWGKENSTYDKLRKAIKHVSHKNSCMLGAWSQANPDCMNNQHPLNDTYVKMIGQAMGGRGEFVDSENKIMKKIAKAVLIDKN